MCIVCSSFGFGHRLASTDHVSRLRTLTTRTCSVSPSTTARCQSHNVAKRGPRGIWTWPRWGAWLMRMETATMPVITLRVLFCNVSRIRLQPRIYKSPMICSERPMQSFCKEAYCVEDFITLSRQSFFTRFSYEKKNLNSDLSQSFKVLTEFGCLAVKRKNEWSHNMARK